MPQTAVHLDWDSIDLVVFDVDGTLYDQRRLRARMFGALIREAIGSKSLQTPLILRTFRRYREALGDRPAGDFMNRQYELTAAHCGCSVGDVRTAVQEWIERRPLDYMDACRYPGIQQLFEALAASGKTVAVFSDYPATAKLEALGLKSGLVISATDDDVGRLKPDPAGLHKILRLTGVDAARALMIGDRFDRDWEAARRVGMRALIRSRRLDLRTTTFRSYDEALFQPLLGEGWRSASYSKTNMSRSLVTGRG